MSRLYDRLMAEGCRQMTVADVLAIATPAKPWHEILSEKLEREGREGTPTAIDERLAEMTAYWRETRSSAQFDPGALDDAVVISADEVAAYWAALISTGANMLDLVDVIAPPYERLFIEFQRQSKMRSLDLHAWGVLIEGVRPEADETVGSSRPTELANEGWLLEASLVFEFRKGEPVGPIAKWFVRLDQQGRASRNAAGYGAIDGQALDFEGGSPWAELPLEEHFQTGGVFMASHLGAALLAVSLMHCKNVDIRPVDPPDRLSRSYARRKGRPLTRYYVLDIQPMRRVLEREGEAQSKGLKHALHICRGHFKTFSEDAPLFGKHTGTYCWESQVRGKAEHGTVEKDYRIRLDEGLGREYVEVDEHPEITPSAPEHTGLDPDLGGHGLRAHNVTQNLLARAVRKAGHEPRRPKPDEPQFDLAWNAGEVTWEAEVKSLTPQNEEKQLRTALGQVLRYCQHLEEQGRTVRAMIATEVKPSDPSWADLCAREGIVLAWGPENLTVE